MTKLLFYLFIAYMIFALAPCGLMALVYWPLVGMVVGIWLLLKLIGAIF